MSVRVRRLLSFWRARGSVAVAQLVLRKLADALAGRPLFNPVTNANASPRSQETSSPAGEGVARPSLTVAQIESGRFVSLRPIKTYLIPAAERRRVSVITDSISAGSLFGGVGTALIFSAQLANRMDATLRVITRTEKAPPENVHHILSVYGIDVIHEIQFVFASKKDLHGEVDIHADEIFITTSWWTTAATLPGVPRESVIYLLQEDERMFYPFGEDRFKCEEILRTPDIRFLINTRLLFDHLVASGLNNIAAKGEWFEPAFPPSVFHRRQAGAPGKLRFFFYARPNNLRNLFHVGLSVIDRAVHQGILDPKKWDIYLVGKHIPDVTFGDGYELRRLEELDWKSYAELAGSIDLALSLMYTPHPSYPPLDLAASGAVVVTNRFGNKQDLGEYSANIICTDANVNALVRGLNEGVALAMDKDRRTQNFQRNGLGKSWQQSFSASIDKLAETV